MNVQVFESGFTAAEIKLCIKSETGISVASRTIRRWRQALDIRPCEQGTYSSKQLDALVSLAGWLSTGRSINHFLDVHFDLLTEI